MQALRVETFGSVENLTVAELITPTPADGEVLIDVRSAGLNYPDLLMAAGTYQALPATPFTLGMEVAGLVESVGPEVHDVRPGDRVFALVPHGAFAEKVIAERHRVHVLPNSMSLEEGGAFGLVFLTAYLGLQRRAALAAGENVLITGVGGGVGAAAATIAKALGARVIGVTRDIPRARAVVQESVDVFVSADPRTLRDEVLSVTDGRGADVVLDVVGGEVLAHALRSTAWEGRVVIVGFASGGQPAIKPGHLLVKNISISGLQMTDYLDREPETIAIAVRHLGDLHATGRLPIPVTRVGTLAEGPALLAALQRGEVSGKAVLSVN